MNLKELSRILGLSQTTVSRALNNYPEVNEATRKRVNEAARRHGYAPSARARSLAMGRAMAIGHVIGATGEHAMMNPIFSDFIAGAATVYTERSYQMTLAAATSPDRERAIFTEFKRRNAVDGVVLQGPRMHDDRIALLHDLGLPFIVHGRASGIETPYPFVDVNNARAIARAVACLTELGHRRIGLVNGDEAMDFAHRRRAGFLAGLAEAGIEPNPEWMVSAEMTEVVGHRSMARWIAQGDAPTGVVASSILSAIGIRRAIAEAGLRMGHDISVVIFDDMLSYLHNGGSRPAFTAVQSSIHEAGRILAAGLLDRIAQPAAPPMQRLLDATLIAGQSTGPAPT